MSTSTINIGVPHKPVTLIVDLEPCELACRIAEIIIGVKRPADMTAKDALAYIGAREQDDFLKAAMASIAYMAEQSKHAVVPS